MMPRVISCHFLLLLLLLLLHPNVFFRTVDASVEWKFHRINVVDADTQRGIPLVKVVTPGYISYYSDSAGIVAFDEPGLLDMTVYFIVKSDGYRVVSNLVNNPQDGVLVRTATGNATTIRMQREQPAERLYRLTGGGIYRDSLIVGEAAPIDEPLLSNAGILGQDSLMAIPFKKQVMWFFGDSECPQGPRSTDCQHYNRYTTGATTPFPPKSSGIVPSSLAYFTTTNSSAPGGMDPSGHPNASLLASWNPGAGFSHARAMLAGPTGMYNMSTWIGSLTSLTIRNESRLYCTYVCPNGGPDKLYGLARWNETYEVFRPVPGNRSLSFRYSGAQVVQKLSPADATDQYVYYASAFATERILASSFEEFEDPSSVEYFTPCSSVRQGGCANTTGGWGWKSSDLASDGRTNPDGHARFGPAEEAETIAAGHLDKASARMQVIDSATGKSVGGTISRGSVNWNARRKKYVLIGDRQDATPERSTSRYGEIYYCEADTIVGPWKECTVVATHNVTGTSCYNPLQLPWLDEEDGKVIYFACTFTSMASSASGDADPVCRFDQYGGVGCSVAVPRYEYNNVVFRLDVDSLMSRGRL